jgi:hypothetical protein
VEPVIAKDANGRNIVGTLEVGNLSSVQAISATTDKEYVLIWSGDGIQAGSKSLTLISSGVSYEIVSNNELISLYKDLSQTVDDGDLGTRAWKSEINNITFDWLNREIIVPNSIISFDVSYSYRAWRNKIEADKTLMRYGIAMIGKNQPKSQGIVGNTHLWNPEWSFDNHWVINVLASRPKSPLLEIKASTLKRIDKSNSNNLIYKSPLGNGTAVILKIISGVDTESNILINNKLDNLKKLSGDIQGDNFNKDKHSLSKITKNIIDNGVLTKNTILDLFNE